MGLSGRILSDAGRAAGARVLARVNTRRCRRARWWPAATRLAGAGVLALAPLAGAQPEPAHAMADFQRVEQRVRSWSEAPIEHEGSHAGASIVLRLDGEVLGRGTAMGEGSLSAALEDAMAEAARRAPVERDALWAQQMAALGGRLAISLELAGPLVPFEPDALVDASLEVSPGREGVAVRVGERTEAMFPGTMLATMTEPASALASLMARVTEEPALSMKSPGELRESLGAKFYRFKVAHIAHPGAGASEIFLHRGGRIVPRGEIDGEALLSMADGTARFLMRRSVETEADALRLRGTLNPVTGSSASQWAGPLEHALAVLALVEYAEIDGTAGAAEARRAAGGLLEGLARRIVGEGDGNGDGYGDGKVGGEALMPLGAAALTSAAIARFEAGRERAGEDPIDGSVRALAGWCDGRLDRAAENPAEIPERVRGAVAYGLALRGTGRDEPASGGGRRADAVLERMLRESEPSRMVAQMPWLGWALLERSAGGESVRGAVLLRRMREIVWEHQLDQRDTGPEAADLIGGIVFTRSRLPLPTWQALRPLSMLATMAGDARLTPAGEVNGQVSRLVSSLRFVRQLAADRACGHMYRAPEQARWGIRSALWDQRMRPEASAMALLTVCETLESLGEIERRRRPEAGAGTPAKPGESGG